MVFGTGGDWGTQTLGIPSAFISFELLHCTFGKIHTDGKNDRFSIQYQPIMKSPSRIMDNDEDLGEH